VLTPGPKGMKGAIAKAENGCRGSRQIPAGEAIRKPRQSGHSREDTGRNLGGHRGGGKIDVFVSGVGTGGPLTGVSRYIKGTRGKKILTVAWNHAFAGHHPDLGRPAAHPVAATRFRASARDSCPRTLDL